MLRVETTVIVPEEEIVWLIVSNPSVEIDKVITIAVIAKKTGADNFLKNRILTNAP